MSFLLVHFVWPLLFTVWSLFACLGLSNLSVVTYSGHTDDTVGPVVGLTVRATCDSLHLHLKNNSNAYAYFQLELEGYERAASQGEPSWVLLDTDILAPNNQVGVIRRLAPQEAVTFHRSTREVLGWCNSRGSGKYRVVLHAGKSLRIKAMQYSISFSCS